MKKILSFIAMAAFVAVPMFTSCTDKEGDETVTADTTALEAEISACEELLADADGSYPAYAISDLEEILNTVNEAMSSAGLSQTVVNNLLAQLQGAKETFLAAEFEAIPEANLLLAYDFENTTADPQVHSWTV